MPATKRRPKAPKHYARHPWEEWFARKQFTLRRGVDYAGPTYSFVQQIGVRARRDGLVVSATRNGDAIEVVVHGPRE